MKKGAKPLAPEGRHNTQPGAVLDRAVVPLADEAPEPMLPTFVLPPLAALDEDPARDPALEADPVLELPVVEPPGAVAVGAAPTEFVEVAVPAALVIVGRFTAPYGLARPPPATAAPLVVAVVCAAAGRVSATQSTAGNRSGLAITHDTMLWYSRLFPGSPNFSRLSPAKFPVTAATGIRRQVIGCNIVF